MWAPIATTGASEVLKVEAIAPNAPALGSALFYAAISFTAVGVGGLAAYAPGMALVFAGLILLAATAAFFPKFFVGVCGVSFLFVRTLEYRFGSHLVGYLDETLVCIAVAVLPFVRIVSGRRLRTIPGLVPFVIFLAFGVGSAAVNSVPAGVIISGLLLAGKGIAFGAAVAQIEWRPDDLPKLAKVSCWVMSFVIACAVVNVLAPGFWLKTVLQAPSFGPRFGLQPILGPFVHPGYFGTCLALFALGLLAYRLHVRSSLGNTVLLSAAIIFSILTFRRKVLAALAIGTAFLLSRVWGLVGFVAALVFAPVFIFLSWGYLTSVVSMTYSEYVVGFDQVARVRLYIDGAQLTLDNFPFGLGFGRFATAAARAEYSPVYYELGYQHIWGLGPNAENGKFLTDTFWPGVFGESGLLGGGAYIAGLVAVFCAARRFSRRGSVADATSRWMAVVVCAWTVELTVESLAGAVFTAAPTYGIFFGAIGVFAGISSYYDEAQSEVRRNEGEPSGALANE